MKQLTTRQSLIYDYIVRKGSVSNRDIKAYLEERQNKVSRLTILRDLDKLVAINLIQKQGAGRSIQYRVKSNSVFLRYIDPNIYFEQDVDQRHIQTSFNFNVFSENSPLFSESELKKLTSLTETYTQNRQSLNNNQQQKELERLTIELSWKSSQIEGNTYSLLDTEALIKEQRHAPGTTTDEANMILNHKQALDYILSSTETYKTLSIQKIETVHQLLIKDLNVTPGLRQGLVRITGSNFKPLDNQHQIREGLEKMVSLVDHYEDVYHKALLSVLFISYIQPFMDGNKRTARLIGNALLHGGGACPLSYRSVDPVDYKKAMLLFYEQNSLTYFKELFIEQYTFSVENYFT